MAISGLIAGAAGGIGGVLGAGLDALSRLLDKLFEFLKMIAEKLYDLFKTVISWASRHPFEAGLLAGNLIIIFS